MDESQSKAQFDL